MSYRNGLPVVTVPLPSRRESCEFTLKSLSQNVGDFTKFIKDEDGGVDTVAFFTKGRRESILAALCCVELIKRFYMKVILRLPEIKL